MQAKYRHKYSDAEFQWVVATRTALPNFNALDISEILDLAKKGWAFRNKKALENDWNYLNS